MPIREPVAVPIPVPAGPENDIPPTFPDIIGNLAVPLAEFVTVARTVETKTIGIEAVGFVVVLLKSLGAGTRGNDAVAVEDADKEVANEAVRRAALDKNWSIFNPGLIANTMLASQCDTGSVW